MIAFIMKHLAQFDFDRGHQARFKNKFYQNEYGKCYAQAESQGHYTGV